MENKFLGKYRLDRVIGRGAMGVIYEAFDPLLHRQVAIKTMTSDLGRDTELRRRFYQEARAAGTLRHPNIITIHDLGEDGQTPYIVMEILQGTDLRTLLEKETLWPYARIEDVGIQAARGLLYAHQHKIVHRDIKPANLFLCEDGTIKILDFGVAHVVSSSMTQEGILLGTIGYMAPEMVSGSSVDARADLYSLGVILYELTTGTKPFVENNLNATLHAILKTPPIPPTSIREDCPPALEDIILKALEKDRDRRYPSLAEMLEALEALLPRVATTPIPPPQPRPAPQEESDTRQWMTLPALLEKAREEAELGRIPEAVTLLREHHRLYHLDPEYQACFRRLQEEKDRFDNRALFQKHYHEATRLLDEDNLRLARLELETLARIDASSPLISQLEQKISRRDDYWRIVSWKEEADLVSRRGDPAALATHLAAGRQSLGRSTDFEAARKPFLQFLDELLVKRHAQLAAAGKNDDIRVLLQAVETACPDLPALSALRPPSVNQGTTPDPFLRDQLQIAERLIRSGHLDQARSYLLVLLEKFPGTPEYEEQLMMVENQLDREGNTREILAALETGDLEGARSRVQALRQAHPADPSLPELEQALSEATSRQTETSSPNVEEVEKLLRTQDYAGAEAKARLLCEVDPTRPASWALLRLVEVEIELAHQQNLARLLQKALTLDRAGDLGGVLEAARELAEIHPEDLTLSRLQEEAYMRFLEKQGARILESLARGQEWESAQILLSSLEISQTAGGPSAEATDQVIREILEKDGIQAALQTAGEELQASHAPSLTLARELSDSLSER